MESPPRAPLLLAAKNSNRSSHLRPSADGDCDGSSMRNEVEPENQQYIRRHDAKATARDVDEREREKRSLDKGDDEYRVNVRGEEGDSNAKGEAIEAEAEELAQKPWNLRPRKATMKASMEIGGGGAMIKHEKLHEVHQQTESLPKLMRLHGYVEADGIKRKEKWRFWIALAKEEIEEDIYALTGLKPTRRPCKRARNV
ncbi:hypothetical protein Ancab_024621 [Ancistrocladus abbreviatus]